MRKNNKRGITVTSIVVYVMLFFMFTTITITLSSRFNQNLFNDRGTAINVTAMNKLEYNLLESADSSYNVVGSFDTNKTILTFSNSDKYVFDMDKHIIYKNGGKLIEFVKECKVNLIDNVIDIDITLNKYTNEVTRNIKINIEVYNEYISNGMMAHFDGINNTGAKEHRNDIMTWNDISQSGMAFTLSSNFTNDGRTNGWTENGCIFPKSDNAFLVSGVYSLGSYSNATFEFHITLLDELGTGEEDYVFPLHMETIYFGMRKDIKLMYGFGNNTVFDKGNAFEKGKQYTITYVQNNLTTRTLYINGVNVDTKTGLALTNINMTNIKIAMQNSSKGAYIIHSLRLYNRALEQNEVVTNYNNDKLRFGD